MGGKGKPKGGDEPAADEDAEGDKDEMGLTGV